MFLSRVASIHHQESDDHSVRFSNAAKHFATRNVQNAYKKRIRETKNDCIASIYAEISHELRQHLSTSDANVLKAQGSFATNIRIAIHTQELVAGDCLLFRLNTMR